MDVSLHLLRRQHLPSSSYVFLFSINGPDWHADSVDSVARSGLHHLDHLRRSHHHHHILQVTVSTHIVASAVECDDYASSTDSEATTCDTKHEIFVQEAMSLTATTGMHVASDEAISRRSCSDPQNGRKKNRQSGFAGASKSAKKAKTDLLYTPAPGNDGMLQCIFVQGECIPLWPQYLDRTPVGTFIRVGAREFCVCANLLLFTGKVCDEAMSHNIIERKTVCTGFCLICMQ